MRVVPTYLTEEFALGRIPVWGAPFVLKGGPMSTAVHERSTLSEYVQRVVAEAPALTAETRDRIVALFRAGGVK